MKQEFDQLHMDLMKFLEAQIKNPASFLNMKFSCVAASKMIMEKQKDLWKTWTNVGALAFLMRDTFEKT